MEQATKRIAVERGFGRGRWDLNKQRRGAFDCYRHKTRTQMRKMIIAATLVAIAAPAWAQQSPPANADAKTPAVNTPNSPPNPGAPAAGANSFTEGQAKSRIEADGFSQVSGLKKDDAGVWRGKAMKSGKTVNVTLDFQGNVVGQ